MTTKGRGLGRGLSALLPSDEGVRSLPIGQLRPSRWQPRTFFDESGLAELAESIRTQGIVQPLVVAPKGDGTYTIIAGERRWRAAQRAGLAIVPVVVRLVQDDRQLLELALVENLQRSDLNPIEEAEAFRSLAETFGLSHEEIAVRVGKARPAVSNTMRLLRLPPGVQDLLRAGRLSAGQARPLLAIPDPNEQLRLAERAAQDGLTVRALEEIAQGKAPGEEGAQKKRSPRPLEPNAAAAAERLTQRLQTKVEIERRGRGGVIRIHFHSEEELIRLHERLLAREGERG